MNLNLNKKEEIAPVLLIFFNRPKTLQNVFAKIKEAKPKTLFLYQDGPRPGRNDEELILECRKIVEDINWDCQVHKLFQTENIGCDPSEYIAQKWAFSIVDKCIILEDDDLPSNSFFSFCTKMLYQYENDNRISIISGMNHLEIYNSNNYDYIFTSNCSIWGWASWKRVIDSWDPNYTLYLKAGRKEFEKRIKNKFPPKVICNAIDSHIKSGKEHYESILIYNSLLNNQLAIVPTKNLIVNIGNNPEGGTHSSNSIAKLPRKIQKIFKMNLYEYKDIRIRTEVIEDTKYSKSVFKLMGWYYPFSNFVRKLEVFIRKLWIKN